MADARTFVKLPAEKMSDFNKRLLTACEEDEVTTVMLHVIDGEPVVTLFSEILIANEEDVAEALDDDPDSTLKVGDELPEEPPVFVQVAKISCLSDELSKASQNRMETMYNRAGGQIVKLLKDSCSRFGFINHPDSKKDYYGEEVITYMAVVAYIPEEDEGDDERMEANLRGAERA